MTTIHDDSSLYGVFSSIKKDPKADHFFLMSSVLNPALICVIHLYLVFSVLPKHMKNRPAYNIDKFVICYNAVQVVLNIHLLYLTSKTLTRLNWFCTPMIQGDTPEEWYDIKISYYYLLLKYLDLVDTIIIVLRKKFNQITFLHIFHHIGMVMMCWYGVAYLNGGNTIYLGLANCTVHTVMYFYFLLIIWRPEYKKSIWWKKTITRLQIAQFLFLFITYGNLLLRPDCPCPRAVAYIGVGASSSMLILFGNFYYKTYIQTKPKKA